MKKWHKFFEYLKERLEERSTKLGIVAVLSAAGFVIDPVLLESIIAVGTIIAGLILILTKDYKNDTRRRSSAACLTEQL